MKGLLNLVYVFGVVVDLFSLDVGICWIMIFVDIIWYDLFIKI